VGTLSGTTWISRNPPEVFKLQQAIHGRDRHLGDREYGKPLEQGISGEEANGDGPADEQFEWPMGHDPPEKGAEHWSRAICQGYIHGRSECKHG
jgi:hypothetical protein